MPVKGVEQEMKKTVRDMGCQCHSCGAMNEIEQKLDEILGKLDQIERTAF